MLLMFMSSFMLKIFLLKCQVQILYMFDCACVHIPRERESAPKIKKAQVIEQMG